MAPTASAPAGKKHLFRRGLIVLIALLILEVLDYYTARLLNGPVTILFVLALINAALIAYYYMHITTLFSAEGDH